MHEKELRQEFILGLSELGIPEETIMAVLAILPNTQAMLRMMDMMIEAHEKGKELTQQLVFEMLIKVSDYTIEE